MMAAGDIVKEFGMLVRRVKMKTGAGCAKGDVLAWDTDGYAPATAASLGPFLVALETVAGASGVQKEVLALEEGVVEVGKDSSEIRDGAWVAPSSSAGKVTAFAPPDAPSSYSEANMQAELDKVFKRIGRAHGPAGANDATVKIRLLSC
jgi:hypothetical protein